MYQSSDEKRKQLKRFYQQRAAAFQAWIDSGYDYIMKPKNAPMPDYLRGLQCGARTKATGEPCKRNDIYANGRCKLHGGMSTGPKTADGKRKVALNGSKKKQSP